jgi:hypothetical protein
MRRTPWIVLALASLPAVAAADATLTRRFPNKNFEWTLPSDKWSFLDCSPDQLANGYVVGAGRRFSDQAWVEAFARVVPADGLPLAELTHEVLDGTSMQLSVTAKRGSGKGKLSGLDGTLVVVEGTVATGAKIWFRAWSIERKGVFHQLLLTAYNDAQTAAGAEVDALRRAYRLLEGAGPREGPSAGGEEAGSALGGDFAEGSGLPPKGPKLEGRTLVFPSQNLRWTPPEDSPFAWSGFAQDESVAQGDLVQARARSPRTVKKDHEPAVNAARVTLRVYPRLPGYAPEEHLNGAPIKEAIADQIFRGKVESSRTRVEPSVPVGNVRGSVLLMAGMLTENVVGYFMIIATAVRDKRYEWQILMEGGNDALDAFRRDVFALVQGVEFPDTTEGVYGPVGVDPVPPHGFPRGVNAQRELRVPGTDFEARKPAGLAEIEVHTEADPNVKFAWEARSADGRTYLFFDMRAYDLRDVQSARKDLEDFVKEREPKWRTTAGTDAKTVTRGRDPWFRSSWGSSKGLGWRFTGSFRDEPFVEEGWVIRGRSSVFVLRVQFGGTNAEKAMDRTWKAIRKAVDLK